MSIPRVAFTPELRAHLRRQVDEATRKRLRCERRYVQPRRPSKPVFLSPEQRAVLSSVYALDQGREDYNSMTGVRWCPPTSTPTHRASLSRTLRRLERRGFLLRLNKQGDLVTRYGGNTRHVVLTLEGRTAGARCPRP